MEKGAWTMKKATDKVRRKYVLNTNANGIWSLLPWYVSGLSPTVNEENTLKYYDERGSRKAQQNFKKFKKRDSERKLQMWKLEREQTTAILLIHLPTGGQCETHQIIEPTPWAYMWMECHSVKKSIEGREEESSGTSRKRWTRKDLGQCRKELGVRIGFLPKAPNSRWGGWVRTTNNDLLYTNDTASWFGRSTFFMLLTPRTSRSLVYPPLKKQGIIIIWWT